MMPRMMDSAKIIFYYFEMTGHNTIHCAPNRRNQSLINTQTYSFFIDFFSFFTDPPRVILSTLNGIAITWDNYLLIFNVS